MSNDEPKPKIGSEHFGAMARLGLAELRAAVVFSESNVVQPAPYGLYGTKTPGEVQDDRKESAREPEAEAPSVLDSRLGETTPDRGEQDREPPQPERE